MFQLCRSLSPRIGCSLLLILVLGGMEQLAAKTVELRDIAVTGSAGTSATITLLVTGRVETVVVERKGRQTAEVRMKSLRADAKALTSALLRPGMKSVRAHIERRDVLVDSFGKAGWHIPAPRASMFAWAPVPPARHAPAARSNRS